jgi:hypothetical protein
MWSATIGVRGIGGALDDSATGRKLRGVRVMNRWYGTSGAALAAATCILFPLLRLRSWLSLAQVRNNAIT